MIKFFKDGGMYLIVYLILALTAALLDQIIYVRIPNTSNRRKG
jgi:hypothetical protein